MIAHRRTSERGHANHGWLDSHFTFSFAEYYDPKFMGFRDLRVINEDRIAGGKGFQTHPHADMEIITYVISGALAHKDSLGNGTTIKPGEVQHMSAGTGIRHSEFNPLPDTETHLLQIWILPDKRGYPPGYGQKDFAQKFLESDLTLTVSKTGRNGSIAINQDVDLYVAKWREAKAVSFKARADRGYWLQVVSGEVKMNNLKLTSGDGGAVTDESELKIQSQGAAEFLLFDLN